MKDRLSPEARAGLLFIVPALTLITIFFLLPVLAGFLLSLTDFDIYSLGSLSNTRIVGVANYRELLRNAMFWQAMRNTLYFSIVGGPLTIIVALATALLLNTKAAVLKPLFRTIYFAPVVTTIVAVAIVWRYLYHPRVGLLNQFLAMFGVHPIDWLGDARWAMPAVILFAVWKNFGYATVFFVAGLQGIAEEMYEAARIDGASAWRQFWLITLPSLGPTFVFVSIITAIGYMQLFTEPYVMTPDGGPLNSTLSIVMLMYREGFRWWNMGYAAAIAAILFAIVVGGTALQAEIRRRRAA